MEGQNVEGWGEVWSVFAKLLNQMLNDIFDCASLYIAAGSLGQGGT